MLGQLLAECIRMGMVGQELAKCILEMISKA